MNIKINPLVIALFTLCTIISTKTSAQENDVKLFNNDVQSNTRSKGLPDNDAQMLKKLVYKKVETAYLSNNESKPIMLNTERVVVDVASLNTINRRPSNMVKVLVIKVLNQNDLSKTIDYDAFSVFPNLECIYISCEVEASQPQIIRMIKKREDIKYPPTFLGINIPI